MSEALCGRFDPTPPLTEIVTSLQRLAAAIALEPDATPEHRKETIPLDRLMQRDASMLLADGAPTPEEHLLLQEEERSRAELILAIRVAAADLPVEDRYYLQTVFSATDPLPPREIAGIMGCGVEDVYRLRQRARRWIAQIAERLEKTRYSPSQQDDDDLDQEPAPARAI